MSKEFKVYVTQHYTKTTRILIKANSANEAMDHVCDSNTDDDIKKRLKDASLEYADTTFDCIELNNH
jgi:hypothetical protein